MGRAMGKGNRQESGRGSMADGGQMTAYESGNVPVSQARRWGLAGSSGSIACHACFKNIERRLLWGLFY